MTDERSTKKEKKEALLGTVLGRLREGFGSLGNGHAPHNDWKVILVVATLLFIALLFRGFSLFSTFSFENEFFTGSENIVPEVETIDRALLEEQIETYEARTLLFDSVLEQPPSVIDPSL